MVLQGKRHRLFGDGDSGECLFGCARQDKGGAKWLILQSMKLKIGSKVRFIR